MLAFLIGLRVGHFLLLGGGQGQGLEGENERGISIVVG